MSDAVRRGQIGPDILRDDAPLVTLDVVSQRFLDSGLPRSLRTLQRYCANGTLDCVKEATDTGDTYFVLETSIDPAITSLRQLHDAKSQRRSPATGHDASTDVGPGSARTSLDDSDRPCPPVSDQIAPQPHRELTATGPDMPGYVAQLETRLGEKDEEIAFLREELVGRRGQIRDMKGIIDGQNQLLEAIQRNVAPIFNALASTVRSNDIALTPDAVDAGLDGSAADQGSLGSDARQQSEQ